MAVFFFLFYCSKNHLWLNFWVLSFTAFFSLACAYIASEQKSKEKLLDLKFLKDHWFIMPYFGCFPPCNASLAP